VKPSPEPSSPYIGIARPADQQAAASLSCEMGVDADSIEIGRTGGTAPVTVDQARNNQTLATPILSFSQKAPRVI